MTSDIDFVIAWVDGSDPEWQKQRAMYRGDEEKATGVNGIERYREWGTLRYWFRCVEKYAPWVRKIHFVTCGQLPEWLNINHPKINFVRHEDYIPHEWLPVFSANPIELNLFRIKGLSEKFVFFNDDMFVNAPVKPEDFFVNNLPCDCAGLNPAVTNTARIAPMNHVTLNDLLAVGEFFDFHSAFNANFTKWINWKYSLRVLCDTALMFPYCYFRHHLALRVSHVPCSYLRSTFIEVWDKCREACEAASSHRFRDKADVNQWLMQFWQIMSGKFYPRRANFSARYDGINEKKAEKIYDDIIHHRHKLICINDDDHIENFDAVCAKILKAYSEIFTEKSEFEK